MSKFNKTFNYFYVFGVVLVVSKFAYAENPFKYYDNNAVIGYSNSVLANNDSYGNFLLNVEALFDNNVWLTANGGYLLYVARQDYPLNKITGAQLGLGAGYAFQIGERYNLIPFVAAQHNGYSISNGWVSSAVSYADSYGIGFINEYDIFPKTLKARLNTNFMTQNTKTSYVSATPIQDSSSYTTYINASPSVQWNITDFVTTQFSYTYTVNTLSFSKNVSTVNFSLGILFK